MTPILYGLCYHDVVAPGEYSSSGFGGADANWYKLERELFDAHLRVVVKGSSPSPIAATPSQVGEQGILLTFDDAGSSALYVADTLERAHLRGWFFVPTVLLGTRAFLDRPSVRELHARGHHIGSHSHSHPMPMTALSDAQIRDEWYVSQSILQELLGERVAVASAPGGFTSAALFRACERLGFTDLFTSEPAFTPTFAGSLRLIGRVSVTQGTSARYLSSLIENRFLSRSRSRAWWRTKQAIKSVGVAQWLELRRRLFAAAEGIQRPK